MYLAKAYVNFGLQLNDPFLEVDYPFNGCDQSQSTYKSLLHICLTFWFCVLLGGAFVKTQVTTPGTTEQQQQLVQQ
jgi:hypothetical protein